MGLGSCDRHDGLEDDPLKSYCKQKAKGETGHSNRMVGEYMKRAKIAISFDDGRKDNVSIISHLTESGIPATLYVTTGYVDGSCPYSKLPTQKPAMTVEEVVQLFHNPLVEIGMHGDMHLNEDWDIRNGRNKLLSWLDLDESFQFGFASPSTAFPIERFLQSKDPLFVRDIAYLATGLRNTTHRQLRLMARKSARLIHSGLLFKTEYLNTLMINCPLRNIYRVPILGDTTSNQVQAFLDDVIHLQAAVVFMFHSIGNHGKDTWTWDTNKFERLCNFLNIEQDAGRLELCTVMQAFRALKESVD